MKINFFKKTEQIKEESLRIKLLKELEYGHGYSVLRSSESLKEHDFLVNIASDADNVGYMSQELGDELDKLFLEDDYSIGIHRTGYTMMNDEILNDMFSNGLINNGHLGSGANIGQFDIDKTVTFFNDFSLMYGQLKAASAYKNSQGCIIVKIPKSYLGLKEGEIKPIFNKENTINRLLPEFIYGYVPVNENNVGEIIHNPNYKDIHNYDNYNQNLYYDSSVVNKQKREKNIDLYLLKKCNVLQTAFIDTFTKYNRQQAEEAIRQYINNRSVDYFTKVENRNAIRELFTPEDMIKAIMFTTKSDSLDINTLISQYSLLTKEFLKNKSEYSK